MTDDHKPMSRAFFDVLVSIAMQGDTSLCKEIEDRLVAEIPGSNDHHYEGIGGPIYDQQARFRSLFRKDPRHKDWGPEWLTELYGVMTEDHQEDEIHFQQHAKITVSYAAWRKFCKLADEAHQRIVILDDLLIERGVCLVEAQMLLVGLLDLSTGLDALPAKHELKGGEK